jgi:Tfp pilus assembly protein PilN
MYVNLLPKSFIWRQTLQLRLRQWGLFYGLLAIVLVCLNAPLFYKWTSRQSQLQETHDATVHIRQLQAQRISLAKEVVAFERKTGQLKQSLTTDRSISILSILASGVLATDRRVQIQEAQVIVSPRVNESTNSASQNASGQRKSILVSTTGKSTAVNSQLNEYRLTLRGVAINGDSINSFVKSLQESKGFPVVELRSTHEQTVSARPIHEFQLECLGYE